MNEYMILSQVAASTVAGIALAVVFCVAYIIALVIEGVKHK